MRLKSLLFVGVTLLMMIAFSVPVAASKDSQNKVPSDISAPTKVNQSESRDLTGKIGNGNDETPGEWYAGETPSNMKDDSPVLLFVHGLNSKAQVWWEDNDMYETALQSGYQTAFVQLHDAGGEAADMWDNGELLSDMIEDISDHFDGRPITVVAHSKGGVDTQTALSEFDAWKYVDNVITLSSPHHGTELADLAYSSWADWLADLIGMKDDGTYSMQTGYMDEFRSTMDEQPKAYYNNYYTMGGTEWGSPFSSTWLGGVYLSSYGDNDGVVPAESSSLERAQEIAVGDWDHSTIRTGDTFSVFENKLADTPNKQNVIQPKEKKQQKNQTAATNQWVRGGELNHDASNSVTMPVEENVHKVTLDIMTNEALQDVVLIDPNGEQIAPKTTTKHVKQDVYFGDANHHAITMNEPEPGEWQIKMTAADSDAYLLTADYDTGAKQRLYHDHASDQKMKLSGENYELAYRLKANTKQIRPESLEATYRVTETRSEKTQTWTSEGSDLSKTLTFNKPDRVYNITVDIKGETRQGQPFQRTIIDSVYSEKN